MHNPIVPNLTGYINGFSKNIREIFERFEFADEIRKMADKNLLYELIKKFNNVDLSPCRIDNMQMGYIFEELIRIGAEQSNEDFGYHKITVERPLCLNFITDGDRIEILEVQAGFANLATSKKKNENIRQKEMI